MQCQFKDDILKLEPVSPSALGGTPRNQVNLPEMQTQCGKNCRTQSLMKNFHGIQLRPETHI
jgi:hypothetical protein